MGHSMATGLMPQLAGLIALPDTNIILLLVGVVVTFVAALYLLYQIFRLVWAHKGIAILILAIFAVNLVVLWRIEILPPNPFETKVVPPSNQTEITLSLCQEADLSDCLRLTSPEPEIEVEPSVEEIPSALEASELTPTEEPSLLPDIEEPSAVREEPSALQDEIPEQATSDLAVTPQPKPAPESDPKDTLAEAISLMSLGALKVEDRPDEALALYQEALGIFRDLEAKDQISRALLDIGHASLISGDIDAAFDYSTRSLIAAQEIGYDFVSIRALINLGYIMMTKRDPKGALDYYNQALDLAEPNGNSLALATLYGNIGYAHSTNGDDRKAIVFFKQSLKVATEIGDANTIKIALKNLSDAEGRQN